MSSGLTTVIGFLALLFMRFGIGPDLGRALAKGIGISLLTVFLFMPATITVIITVLPIFLVLAIETAIWINLTIPYLQNTPLFYIAYLIISSVQLGATVDYAILFSDRYRECRREMDKKESIIATISQTSVSILTSGITMIAVGFLLGIISTHGLLSQLCIAIRIGLMDSPVSLRAYST